MWNTFKQRIQSNGRYTDENDKIYRLRVQGITKTDQVVMPTVISTCTVPKTWDVTKASPSRLERESEIESIEGGDVSNVEDKKVVVAE